MSNVHPINAESVIESQRLDRASEWVAKMDRDLTHDEKAALEVWLAQDVENLKVLLEMATMWDKMTELGRLSDIFPQVKNEQKKSSWFSAMAASILVIVGVGIFQFLGAHNPATPQASVIAMQTSYQTAVGESTTINLPDDSVLVLNTNSFVQVKYSATDRVIELQRGEINIEVAHDTSRPLSVLAGGKVIRAVGTAFNVDVRSDRVELIVTDGKVLVAKKSPEVFMKEIQSPSSRKVQSAMLAVAKDERVTLKTEDPVPISATKTTQTEIASKLSWRTGNLIFKGETLEEAMTEISRYTDVQFELADNAELKKIKVAGMFKIGDVNGLLSILDQNFNVSHEKISRNNIKLDYAG